jgi:uncharacterized membrane protein
MLVIPMSKRTPFFLLALIVLPFLMAHGGGGCGEEDDDDELFGPPTQAACPTSSTLTYANFGQPFMTNYCIRCHNSALTGAARQGAPRYHDFDLISDIQSNADHIDQTTAAGPAVTNMTMPYDGPMPTAEERMKLGEWLACGAPN